LARPLKKQRGKLHFSEFVFSGSASFPGTTKQMPELHICSGICGCLGKNVR